MFGIFKKCDELKKQLEEKNKETEILESYNKILSSELQDTKGELARTEARLAEYITLSDGTPEDCKRGKWCAGCEFAKEIVGYDGRIRHIMRFCGKGEACANFVQKER